MLLTSLMNTHKDLNALLEVRRLTKHHLWIILNWFNHGPLYHTKMVQCVKLCNVCFTVSVQNNSALAADLSPMPRFTWLLHLQYLIILFLAQSLHYQPSNCCPVQLAVKNPLLFTMQTHKNLNALQESSAKHRFAQWEYKSSLLPW